MQGGKAQPQLAHAQLRQALSEQDVNSVMELVSDRKKANAVFDPQKGFTLLHIAVLQVRIVG
jgi:hypothetical protein